LWPTNGPFYFSRGTLNWAGALDQDETLDGCGIIGSQIVKLFTAIDVRSANEERAMAAQPDSCQSALDEILTNLRQDPLSPRTGERIRFAVATGCPTCDIARAVYVGLEGALETYWVALQEGKLKDDDGDFYMVVGMLRYVRTCHEDRARLLAFPDESPDFFETLGRTTSSVHQLVS
jgi:hypothetical protein